MFGNREFYAVLTNPAAVGQFFGEIVRGFNGAL